MPKGIIENQIKFEKASEMKFGIHRFLFRFDRVTIQPRICFARKRNLFAILLPLKSFLFRLIFKLKWVLNWIWWVDCKDSSDSTRSEFSEFEIKILMRFLSSNCDRCAFWLLWVSLHWRQVVTRGKRNFSWRISWETLQIMAQHQNAHC